MKSLPGYASTVFKWLIGFQIVVMMAAGCSTNSGINAAAADYGSRVDVLANAIRSRVIAIQSELAKPQPDTAALQTAHAEIKEAYLKLNDLGAVPDGLANLHDLSIGAAFDCEYLTQQAIAGQAADLDQCLSEIEKVLELTDGYTVTPTNGT